MKFDWVAEHTKGSLLYSYVTANLAWTHENSNVQLFSTCWGLAMLIALANYIVPQVDHTHNWGMKQWRAQIFVRVQ